ncbi:MULTISPECIES: sigma-54 interaction domain-containing protein [Thermoanaerobacter]|uniref:Putative sigma54 specific transcriptional regulator n=2 Tax=Thermoanaerobacter TaxID=1754 RepID=B0K7W8_THEP3|nr:MULTISPECIES: sigma 54-interacting transcriptional regulator [Thermoanaerobacter]ABY95788.1 putative sigma54 specific transcriptional regulator [Thermoanaerobacter pseudethanolicus ATCC 33223]
MRNNLIDSLQETFGFVTELQKECLSFISPSKAGYHVWSPPCTPTCPNINNCPYDLILSFKIEKNNFLVALPKKRSKNLKITPASIIKFLQIVLETSFASEQKTNNILLLEQTLQFLAKQSNIEFYLFNNKGQIILSQNSSFVQLSPSDIWEKLGDTNDSEGFIKTQWGNFYYHLFVKNDKPIGLIIWKIKSFQKNVNFCPSRKDYSFAIIGKNYHFTEIKKLIRQIAATEHTILLQGESGTGKELFARYIHHLSPRKDDPFIAINCAAIPENLLESELFGYEDGSFTGARRGGKPGKFELANGGTIFLDEIGDMPLPLQAKLLRVLEDRQVERIGATISRPVDIRVIAATNKNLKELIDAKLFREDLFFRLSVFPVYIPALRERRDDILLLLDFYLKNICLEQDKPFKIFSPETIEILQNYSWPGNIRELKNVVTYAVSLCKDDIITPQYLPKYLQNGVSFNKYQFTNVKSEHSFIEDEQLKNQLEILLAKYGKSTQSKKLIAQELGISLATLYRWLKKYRIR